MKIVTKGYFTTSRKLERKCVKQVEKYAPKILGDLIGRVKKINIEFHKRPISWKNGYSWIWRNGEITLVIAGGYRSYYRSEWMLCHDLAHARQIMEGRLNKSLNNVWYNAPTSKYFYNYKSTHYGFERQTDGYIFDYPYWEEEANDIVHKVMTKRRSNKAWPKKKKETA